MEFFTAFISFMSVLCIADAYFGTEKNSELCFCKLEGRIDDCSCSVDTVDYFNNNKIYPRLKSLLDTNYFKFYKVNLRKECPFWSDDSRCAIRYCHVEPCLEEDIPAGLKGHLRSEGAAEKYRSDNQEVDCDGDHNSELGYLNTTISDEAIEEFAVWERHDDANDFCVTDEGDDGLQYVDLNLNPERYTGYKGASAHRIWNNIYKENCFRPSKNNYTPYIETANLNGMCLEKRVFYRVISGMHSSINIHLCAQYLLSELNGLGIDHSGGKFGPNFEEFHRRFHPDTTNGEGPHWLRNLYFLYLLELRALAKAAPYLSQEGYFTGSESDDEAVRQAMKDLLHVVQSFPDHFNENVMFTGGLQARLLKEEFKQHFRNISRIMDCVGCEKCKLWGKLQIHGLGTALKILFSGQFDEVDPPGYYPTGWGVGLRLDRNEIVALVNGFGRLSTSIFELDTFRKGRR